MYTIVASSYWRENLSFNLFTVRFFFFLYNYALDHQPNNYNFDIIPTVLSKKEQANKIKVIN